MKPSDEARKSAEQRAREHAQHLADNRRFLAEKRAQQAADAAKKK